MVGFGAIHVHIITQGCYGEEKPTVFPNKEKVGKILSSWLSQANLDFGCHAF